MEIKVASKTEIHEFIKKFPGAKSVIWENDDNTYLLLAKENNHIIDSTAVTRFLENAVKSSPPRGCFTRLS